MKLIIYNQNNYNKIPYPSKEIPEATLASGGCGVVSMMMVLANMAGVILSPQQAAEYAMKAGARVVGGTDMNKLANAVCRDYGFEYFGTDEEARLLRHLKTTGFAIVNVGGDRPGWAGIYSNYGHYVVAAGVSGNKVLILDPGYYKGKYTLPHRKGKVTDNGDGSSWCEISTIAKDAENRSPRYYLFTKEGFSMAAFLDTKGHWAEKIIEKAAEKGIIKGKEDGLFHPDDTLTRAEFLVVLDRLGLLDK